MEFMTTADQARQVLDGVKDSGSGKSIIKLGWLDQIRVNPPKAIVRFLLPSFAQSQRESLAQEIRMYLLEFEDITDVQIEIGNSPSQAPIGQAGHGQMPQLQPIP